MASPDNVRRAVKQRVARPHAVRRSIRRLALAPLIVAIAVATEYFAPAAGFALADVPVIGPQFSSMLGGLGLGAVGDQLTAMDSTYQAAGQRVSLVGGYADPAVTVLVLQLDPGHHPDETTLSDQYGREYPFRSGGTDLLGHSVLTFEPLAWPATFTGARLTLRVDELASGSRDKVIGPWILHAVLAASGGEAVPAAPASAGSVRVTSAAVTHAVLRIEIETDHELADLELLNGAGRGVGPFSVSVSGMGGAPTYRVVALWSRPRAGNYILRPAPGYPDFKIRVTVP